MVADLSELWRAEANQLPLSVAAVDVAAVAREVGEGYLAAAGARGIAVDLPANSLVALADKDRLAQIVSNYLSNALRHAPDGSTIPVAAVATPGHARLSVADEGPGLETGQLDAVFERFYRVDAARSRAAGGSGIGLAIVRALADAMDGEAWAESDGPGRGATFHLELPAPPA